MLSQLQLPTSLRLQRYSLPIGGLTVFTVLIFFSSPAQPVSTKPLLEKLRLLDTVGATLVISAVVCLLLALQWGGTTYAWSNSKVWGCFLGFGLMFIAFGVLQFWLGDE